MQIEEPLNVFKNIDPIILNTEKYTLGHKMSITLPCVRSIDNAIKLCKRTVLRNISRVCSVVSGLT